MAPDDRWGRRVRRNIYKYDAAYRLGEEAEEARRAARERTTETGAPEPK